MYPIFVLTASLELISIESVIKWRTEYNYVHLRQVPNQTFLLASAMLKHVLAIGWTSVRLSHTGIVS